MNRRRAVATVLVLLAALVGAAVVRSAPNGVAAAGGGRFAFVATVDGGRTYQLFTAATTGADRKRVATFDVRGRPAYSPDGSQLLFSAALGDGSVGRYGLYIVGADGSGLHRISVPRFADVDPAWSPDGRSVAFVRNVRGHLGTDAWVIFIAATDGSHPRALVSTRGGRNPAWSPDGRRLAYAAPDGLHVVNVDGSGDRVVTPASAGHPAQPAWSPDGTRIAFVQTTSRVHSRVVVRHPGGGLQVVEDVDGYVESPVWDPDDQALYLVRYHGVGVDGRYDSIVLRFARPGARPTNMFRYSTNVYGLAFSPVVGHTTGIGTHQDGGTWTLADDPRQPVPRGPVTFGGSGGMPVTGDWDGTGQTGVGVVQAVDGSLVWHLASAGGAARATSTFGNEGDVPVTGDWTGDGHSGIGVVREVAGRLRWLLADDPAHPVVNRTVIYGEPGDIPVTGDWNGDRRTGIGIVRAVGAALQWRLSDDAVTPVTTHVAVFGDPGDRPVTGDWDADGTVTPGVTRAVSGRLHWLFAASFGDGRTAAPTWAEVDFGTATDVPVTGDWDGR